MRTETPPDVDIPMQSVDNLIHGPAPVCEDVGSGGTDTAPEAIMNMDYEQTAAKVDEQHLSQNPLQPEIPIPDAPQKAPTEAAKHKLGSQPKAYEDHGPMDDGDVSLSRLLDEDALENGYVAAMAQQPANLAQSSSCKEAKRKVQSWIDKQGQEQPEVGPQLSLESESLPALDDVSIANKIRPKRRKRQGPTTQRRQPIEQPSLKYAACVPPRPEDFQRNHASLNPARWKWVAAESLVQPAPQHKGPLRARMPTVPGWELSSGAPRVSGDAPVARPRRAATSAHPQQPGSTRNKKARLELKEFRHGAERSAYFPILKLPLEIRNKIYRYRLVSDKPIVVYNSWRSVLRHRKRFKETGRDEERPGMKPAILMTCYQIYVEGIQILYGENTFLYMLRDPPAKLAPPVADVSRLAYDGDNAEMGAEVDQQAQEQDSDGLIERSEEEGSEYEDEAETRAKRAPKQRRGKKRAANDDDDDDDEEEAQDSEHKWDINVPRFFDLFRNIVIEAESNRSDNERLERMVQAINVWTSRPKQPDDILAKYLDRAKKGQPARKRARTTAIKAKTKGELASPANIRSLTIRLSPKRTHDSFTFVDFFGEASALTEALKQLEVQFLYVVVKTQHLNISPYQEEVSTAQVPQSMTKHGSRFAVNLRHHRLQRRISSGRQDDPWVDEAGLVKRARAEGAALSLLVIDKIGENVEGCCTKWVEQNGIGLEDEWWEEYNEYFDDTFAAGY